MLLQLVVFFTLASAITTAVVMVPGLVRARAWASIPLGLAILAGAGWLTGLITQDAVAGTILALLGVGVVIETRRDLPQWSMLAAQLLALLLVASVAYLIYAAVQPIVDGLGAVGIVASFVLLLLEASALALSAYYVFEILDVFSRRTRIAHRAESSYRPKVAIQVPCYNEPIEVMRETLTALAQLDYQDLIVQVVDNNTRDPQIWRALEALCKELGERFQFIHLEPWPGYKAGALNEATRRLAQAVSILGIVDADYLVKPAFLKEMVGHFADERVAFVQTPQNYRDWKDSGYLRGLFYSYSYFFDVTMPSRANRNAIIFAGTMGLIRRSALERIGGWDESIITEDAEASLRMLGLGSIGVYEPTVWGEGLMPLSFDGLKKQRFRWALGGIQMLRLHWREMLPFGTHQLRLSVAQRTHYLLACLQWFGEALTLVFTSLLLLTAAFLAVRHRLPVRQLLGAIIVVPPLFLGIGLLRALWGLRATTRCSLPDAVRALGIWFALSWVVTLACIRGLVRPQAAFLRTPKQKEGVGTLAQALNSCKVETALAAL